MSECLPLLCLLSKAKAHRQTFDRIIRQLSSFTESFAHCKPKTGECSIPGVCVSACTRVRVCARMCDEGALTSVCVC